MKNIKSCFKLFLIVLILILTGCGLFVETIPSGSILSKTDKDHFIKIDNINYHYTEYPAKGRDIFLLHGFSSSTYTWEGVAPILQSNGYHVWALDMKGFGWSDKPLNEKYDPLSLMEDVNKWLDEMKLKNVIFVGNSLGGLVGGLLEVKYPDKIHSIVLLDAPLVKTEKPTLLKLASIPFAQSITELIFGKWMVKQTLREVIYNNNLITDKKINAYYDRTRSKNAIGAQILVAKSIHNKQMDEYSNHMSKTKKKTLIIWGENDMWVPLKIGKKIRKEIKNSELIVIPECGHIPMEEFPVLTARLILDFIKGKSLEGKPLPSNKL